MLRLTEDELDIIAENELSDALDKVRDTLREAERANPSTSSQDQADQDTDPQGSRGPPEQSRSYMAAMSRLSSILSAAEVVVLLESRIGLSFVWCCRQSF